MSELLQETQYFDKYSRYRYDLNRRENWPDTVHRVTDYLFSFDTENAITDRERQEIFEAILDKEVMPSMRNLAMAGEAAERQNMCSYNCSYGVPEDLFFFYEAVIILMSGSGLGYSVENKHISKLPVVKNQIGAPKKVFLIPDTTEGWAEAINHGIRAWFSGHDIRFIYSDIRPAGSILKVKGGRASGYEALEESLNRIRDIVLSAQEKRLSPLQVHDIMCHIARCIVSGGVRRSAMICLFDKSDSEMIECKDADNIQGNEQRYLSNNSVAIYDEMTHSEIKKFMGRMFDSFSGEPGIMSKYAVKATLPEGREYTDDFGFNPCGEIVLRPFQTCNLSSAICRKEDTFETLLKKVRIATIIGTLQSMSDYFPNLRPEWHDNQVEERLLGVDLNGIMDCQAIQDADSLRVLRKYAREINRQFSGRLNINESKAITCVKPSGNASVMLGTSAGIHSRFSQYYIRRIQLHEDNPILAVVQLYDIPTEKSNHLPNTFVASFPVKSPEKVKQLTAFEQLENWKKFKVNWTEHNPSCTISYTADEHDIIVDWLFSNQALISGLSFLPRSNAIYEQMPYEAITEGEYNMFNNDMPDSIDWNVLHELEQEDQTNASQTAGCDGDKCLLKF